MVSENSCGRPVYAHVRAARRQHGFMVCDRHVVWGDQQIARWGYQPVHVLARGTTAASREWTSGCEAPKGWKLAEKGAFDTALREALAAKGGQS